MATSDLENPIRLLNGLRTSNGNPIAISEDVVRQGQSQNVESAISNLERHDILYTFDATSNTSDPPVKGIRFNNTTVQTTTRVYIDRLAGTATSTERLDEVYQSLPANTFIRLKALDNPSKFALFKTTEPVEGMGGSAGWFEIPVVHQRDQGMPFADTEILIFDILSNSFEDTDITANSFDNEYSTSLASQAISSETFVVFTAEPNASGSDHSSLNTDTTRVDIDEAGFYDITVNLTVQNTTSTANDRLVPDIKLYKVRSGVASIEAEQSSYIRATTADVSPLAPNDLEFTLSFKSALEQNDQIRVSIQARSGSVSTNAAISNGSLTIRRFEFTGTVASVSNAQILQTINALPSSNPNYYYERLTPSAGLATPSTSHVVLATGDGTDFDVIPTRTSVGGILADIPFENLFQGQIQLQSDVACSLEIQSRFTHFEGQANAFTTPRSLRIDLQAATPQTIEFNGFNSEVIVPLGDITIPGLGTITIDQEFLDAPFPYRLEFRLIAYQLGTNTRIAANISNFGFLNHAIIFKQANRIIGPQGPAGPVGPSTTVAALSSRDILVEPSTPPSAAATAQSFTLTLPIGITSLSQYAFIEIGTSRLVAGQISYELISGATLVAATSSNPLYIFPTGIGGSDYLGSTFSVYLSSPTTLVYRSGANRGFLRRVTGINIAPSSTPHDTWIIEDQTVIPDTLASTNTPLPQGASRFSAYRIGGDGFLLGTAVTQGDWLLAISDTPSQTDINDWDIISGDRFPVSSTLFHFSDQITETTVNGSQQFTLSDFFQLREGNFPIALLNRFTNGSSTDISSLRSKIDALYPLSPNVSKLNDWADLFTPAAATEIVNVLTGYDLLADFRGTAANQHYESAGITYDDAGEGIRYTGLGTNIFRQFGFKVNALAQVDDITLSGTSGTANININGTDYLVTFNALGLSDTATDFVTTHATALDIAGVTVVSNAEVLTFTAKVGGTAFTSAITNATGDLTGSIANTVSTKILLYIVDGANLIPFVDTTVSGTFRINNFIPQQTTSAVITNEPHFLPRSAGSDIVTTTPGSVSTHIITNFPTGATSTSRTLQIGPDILLGGVDTDAGRLVEVPIPATNTAQAKRTISDSIYLGPRYSNRTVDIVIGYEYRVDGANLVVDLTLESAPSDITVRFTPDTATILNYTAQNTVARQDRWQTFRRNANTDYTFTGENELLIHFRPAIGTDGNPTGILETVPAAIGATGSAVQLDDNDIDTPSPLWESIDIPQDIEFRTFGSNHFFRHSDLAALLQGRATRFVYGLALEETVSEHKITGELEFDSFIMIAPDASRHRIQVENDGTLRTTPVT